jgi:isochorismate pyruvate lyase
MADVRSGVDALDRQLVELLQRRQRYMEAAARIKPAAETVRDQARIDEVIANVRAHARKVGLAPAFVEVTWPDLIETSIRHEHQTFAARSLDRKR